MIRFGCACLLIFVPTTLARAQWSVFERLKSESPPVALNGEWSAAVDAFIFARLHQAGIDPAPAVDRAVWIRRVTYDLTGLPPAPDEVRDFVEDDRPDGDAMAHVADRLLASPRYGEHWGRHWLDVVRYADSDGFAIDAERLQLWRYRDYVIRVLNADRPFDQFIREQIAGDEIAVDTDGTDGTDGRVALSYYRLGPWEADNMTAEHRRQDYLNDITTNIGSAFLGLTVGCARCHDHKYDPIRQADFYQLQAFIAPIKQESIAAKFLPGELTSASQQRRDQAVIQRLAKKAELDALRATLRQKIADATEIPLDRVEDGLLDQMVKEKKPPITADEAARFESLTAAVANRQDEQRFEAQVVAVRNPKGDEKAPESFVLNNGDVFDPGEKVVPGFLSAVSVWSPELVRLAADSAAASGGRRKLLAEWLTSPDNPITARVLANRLWTFHMGAGIVATSNDFGVNGSGPSHPQLLDYLARKLIDNGWRLKPLHREIVLSRSYRLSTHNPAAHAASRIDPENRLLWRAVYRRLDAETIRDALLAVSGKLILETGGPGFCEALPEGMEHKYSFFTWEESSAEQRCRRSVYMFLRRNLVHPMMEAFDGPDLNQACELRRASVTAPQALSLFNGRFAHECSLQLARRIREHSADDGHRVERLFWLALSRAPSIAEQAACVEFLNQRRGPQDAKSARSVSSPDSAPADPLDHELNALRDLCLAVINSNEFVYLD